MKATLRVAMPISLVLVCSLNSLVCSAQVVTGVPPFQSFGGGPDIINLGNLNAHYSMPIFHRAGRGPSFDYALAYDSAVWTVAGSAWVPASTWGVNRDMSAAVGVAVVSHSQGACGDPSSNVYTYRGYYDSAGTLHKFFTIVYDSPDCPSGDYQKTVVINDGSGITITVDASPSATVMLKSGEQIKPPLSSSPPTATGTVTDSNGNQITSSVNGTTTKFYDTLSTTTPVLTIDASNASAVKYEYASPANPSATVTASYISYTVQTAFGCSGINEYGPLSKSLLDKLTLADGSFYQFSYETTPGDNHTPHYVTGRVASVTLPTGGTISYTYIGGDTGKGIFCSDGSTAGFLRTTPDTPSGQYWSYARTGTSPSYTTTISSPADPVTGQNDVTVINFQGNYETERKIYQGSGGTPLTDVVTCYNGNLTNCNSTAVTTPFSQITKFTSFNGGPQARLDTFYSGYGLVTEIDAYDFDGTLKQKTTTLYGSYVASNDTCNALTNNIVDRPCKVTVTDGSGNLKAKATYSYDETTAVSSGITTNHISVTGSRGNLTTLSRYSTSTAANTQAFKNYDTGKVYQSQDVNGQWTTYTYGACAGAFPTSVSLPLSLSKSYGWNCTGGVQTSATDENNQSTSASYTSDQYFWRPESTKDQLQNTATRSYPSLLRSESSFNFNGTTSTVDVSNSIDSLGRPLYTQHKQSQSSSNYDTVQQAYDSFGRPIHSTVPYVSSIASPAAPQGTPTTTTYYDSAGRPIQSIDGGGGIVNTTYNLNDVYQEIAPAPSVPPAPATENTKRKQSQYDGLGRLTSVCEITSDATYSGNCPQSNSQTGYYTTYSYDVSPNYNSLTVNQSVQKGTSQSRTYIYDMLGRLVQENNPETAGVATYYFYDSAPATPGVPCSGTYNGDLVKKYDPQGNTICYAYDSLHRLTSITYPAGPNSGGTPSKYFAYDGATVNGQAMANAKGRLAEAYTCTTCPGTKITDLGFSYSARGELTDAYESTPHSSGYYHVTASYWTHGVLNTLSGLPGLPTLNYGAGGSGLDGEGRITQVTASSGQSPLVSGVTYTSANGTGEPIGSLTQVTLGSGDNDTFQYDPNTGRLTQYAFNIGASPNTQTVQGGLTWNANGTLAKLAITDPFDTVNSQTCTFGYDDLARSISANCGTAWNQSFTFDPFGNITKTGTTTFQPGYDQTKNWFQSLPGLSYDSNGNLKNDSFHQYSWDSENRPVTIDTVTLTMDAMGRAVEQARGSSYTEIVYSPGGGKLALMNGQSLQSAFVPLPGGTTAVYTSSGLAYYRHSDWLGSSRFASTPTTRAKYFDVAYAPYGEDYADSGTLDLNFTGQNQDTVSGLYDFMFREYHPVSGRWIQPDPAGIGAVSLANPQTWNRYGYVSNNPLAFVDALGLQARLCGGDCPQEMVSSVMDNGDCTIDGGLSTTCGLASWLQDSGAGVSCGSLIANGYNCNAFTNGTLAIGATGEVVTSNGDPLYLEADRAAYVLDALDANNAGGLRLQVHSDCSRTGYRRIVYEVAGPNANDWYVTEHVSPTSWAPPNGTSTDRVPGQFDDTIFGWQIGNALQSFTISRQNPTLSPGTPSIPIIVQLGGVDYGTLGIWHGGTNGMQFVQGNSAGWASCIRE